MSTGALSDLTPHEREITALVGAGLSNTEIGEHLFISTTTAKTHVNRAMMKVNARDRAQLVVFAYETGLTAPGQPSWSSTGPAKWPLKPVGQAYPRPVLTGGLQQLAGEHRRDLITALDRYSRQGASSTKGGGSLSTPSRTPTCDPD